jgi:hypothetical protein
MIPTRDAFTSSSGNSAVRWLRSRLGHPTAEDLAAAADSLEAETLGHLESTGSPALGGLLERWPEAMGEPALLDTVLDVAVEWFVRERGLDRDAALDRLRDANPNLSAQLELCRVLSDAIGDSVPGASESPDDGLVLPAEVGPSVTGGRRRYDLRELLGRGSQGRVYLAVDRALSDPDRPAWVAVKLARVSSPAAAQKLLDEAAKARRIEHENVVRVLDADVTGVHHTCLVTEYVGGGTLEKLRCGSAEHARVRTAVSALAQVCRGVQAIHSQGLVHCDLKPTNVLLTPDGTPKVADFGLSVRRWTSSAAESSTSPLPAGNLAFMSPEQFRHPERAPAPPGDIYALGGLVLWVLTGHAPNGSTGADAVARLTRSGSSAVEADLAAIADEDLRAITRRAIAEAPAERYGSADALAADLDRWLGHERLSWRVTPLPRRARLFARREPMLSAVAGVAVLVVLGTGIVGGLLVAKAERNRVEATASAAAARAEAARATAEREAAQAKQEASEATIKATQNAFDWSRRMVRMSVGEMSEQWLPLLSALEALAGPQLLRGPGGERINLWSQRIPITSALVDRMEARAGGLTAETAAWRVCLAFWKLRTNDSAGGRDLARATVRLWTERGWPRQDPLLNKLAIIQALAELTAPDADTHATGDELRARIRALATDLSGDYQDDPLVLYARHVLDPDAQSPVATPIMLPTEPITER